MTTIGMNALPNRNCYSVADVGGLHMVDRVAEQEVHNAPDEADDNFFRHNFSPHETPAYFTVGKTNTSHQAASYCKTIEGRERLIFGRGATQ